MSKLLSLKAATGLHDVAQLLGFAPKALAYILYVQAKGTPYRTFVIPKRSGGTRQINAPSPELKKLQRRLSVLLQDCAAEIDRELKIKSAISHGFTRKRSIATNAFAHKQRRYVFNLDLENFFGNINFGRVRGYLISNKNFSLNPRVATIIAQIACYNNCLPQGSPCSPVISNLIGHLLDMKLATFAYKSGCHYTRYADDLTISTNRSVFPEAMAIRSSGATNHDWEPSQRLARIIVNAGFSINATKTRMQYKDSRQEVTGLVVNKKVNTPAAYRKLTRAMVHRLTTTGKFETSTLAVDVAGHAVLSKAEGTLAQLQGRLAFADFVDVFNKRNSLPPTKKEHELSVSEKPNSHENTYRQFLFYRNFYAPELPVILCEGKTDNIYLKCALRRLAAALPALATVDAKGAVALKVKFFQYTKTSKHVIGLGGGTGEINKLISTYKKLQPKNGVAGKKNPVILLIDNDKGSEGTINVLKSTNKTFDPSLPFNHVVENLYVVLTPLGPHGERTMIEDFFDPALLKTKLQGKSFNPVTYGFDAKTEYGKAYFAEYVIKQNEKSVDFTGFTPILSAIRDAIQHHLI